MQIADAVMIVLLVVAVFYDMKERRIPNWLVLAGLIGAFAFNLYHTGLTGVLFGLKGLGLGILLLLVPFAMGGMGAGDVKLLGMVGAFKGAIFVFNAFLWMALFGGAIAILCLIKEGRLVDCLTRMGRGAVLGLTGQRAQVFLGSLETTPFELYFPYGLAIALGAMTAYLKGWC